VESILEGSLPFPPAALQRVCDCAGDSRTPPVMASWAHALAFSAMSSLRQANAQRLCTYGILTFGGHDYLISQTLTASHTPTFLQSSSLPSTICGAVGDGLTAGEPFCGQMAIFFGPVPMAILFSTLHASCVVLYLTVRLWTLFIWYSDTLAACLPLSHCNTPNTAHAKRSFLSPKPAAVPGNSELSWDTGKVPVLTTTVFCLLKTCVEKKRSL